MVDVKGVCLHFDSVQGLKSELVESQMPAALEMLRRMVEINSYTENREGINKLGSFTAKCFAPFGFKPEFIPSVSASFGNHLVLTRRGNSPRNIVLFSHLDTVFSTAEEERNHFGWQREGDRIYGPGTVDIKGGTVMMWLVLSALSAHAPDVFDEITWQCFLNASEERLTVDLASLCRSRLDNKTLCALVFEAEGRSNREQLIVVARKGRGTWRVTVTGRGAHAGGKHDHGANAAVQLGKTIQQVASLTDYSRGLTFNVGSVTGGTQSNRVPHEAVAEGEFRAFRPEVYEDGKSKLLALGGPGEVSSPVDNFKCGVRVEILNETGPWPRNPATDRLFQIWKQAGAGLGLVLGPEERAGLSDGNLIHDAVPTLDGLGPWGDNDHCSERSADGSKLPEFVQVSSFVPKAVLNVTAILRLLKESRC